MNKLAETILDFDGTVGTEDRFAIRRFIARFLEIVNNAQVSEMDTVISDSTTALGLSDFPLQKKQIIEMFYKKFFGRRHNYLVLPKLKLSFNKFMFHLSGTYEEYEQGILTGAGTIDLALIKNDDSFQFVDFKFYPRMRKQEIV